METDRTYQEMADRAMRQISSAGAFLTVKNNGKANTMTIGWALIGYVWRKPVMMVAVRDSRYTFQLMEKSPDFTVSIPWEDLSQDLKVCGSKSGRDMDKFAACRLRTENARQVSSPIITMQGLHYECRIIMKAPMDPALADASLEPLYPQKDYHTLYFGEILECYETDQAAKGGD